MQYSKMQERELLADAVKYWGVATQIGMLTEELGELLATVNRWDRGRIPAETVAEEIADARIMLNQFELMIGGADACRRMRNEKLARLRERLDEEREESP